MTACAWIGLGANLGDRLATLRGALDALDGHPDTSVQAVSGAWETPPVGGPAGQDDFLNAAARLRSNLTPRELLDWLLTVEQRYGRVRRERWGPRTLDLDLLLFDGADGVPVLVDEPGLTVPHAWLTRRRFVLEPLLEIDPHLQHPVNGPLRSVLEELRRAGAETARRVADLR